MAFLNKRKQELQAALENLEAAENRVMELQADFQAIERSVALLVLTRDGLVDQASDVFLDMLGYQRDQLIGQHHRVFCDSDYARSEDYIAFWRELVTGHVKEGRFININAEGQKVCLEARYLPVLSDKGIVKRIIVLVTDAVAQ
ncbi:PAS domain-containing protein [Marinobacter orientalis]|uniref:PAS domain-containing protein n=1 Tax=Marinobacter orientalis TaxID=1928859 RepID=A0A7Y0RC65_9GAMM|nr:PAS domain-containing protein [Marinobacter orientalis]NMT63523.1 PAS domain-containing protein [Marinobacter orientalis]TGX48580.1 PAS domain-containing protein [Marinobacter orientalis]